MGDGLLQEAVTLAGEGRKVEARRLFEQILQNDPANEPAWLGLAECCETPEERAQALESCLRHIPGSQRARAALARLRFTDWSAAREPRPPDAQIPSTGSAPAIRPLASVEPPTVPLNRRVRSPGLEWQLGEGAEIFTVPPEALSPEEFEALAALAEKYLRARPDPLARKARRGGSSVSRVDPGDWDDLAQFTGQRMPKSYGEKTLPVRYPRPTIRSWLFVAAAALIILMLAAAVLLPG